MKSQLCNIIEFDFTYGLVYFSLKLVIKERETTAEI